MAADGAFFAWAYAQFGVPSFATSVWARPDVPEPADDEDADADAGDEEDADDEEEETPAQPDGDDANPTLTPSSVGDISQETLDELEAAAVAEGVVVTDEMRASITPEQVEQYAQTLGVAVRRVPSKPPAKVEGEDAAWLRYNDEVRNGEGFVAWTPFEHPELEPVEIGGWTPYFRTNPPLPDLEPIVEVQTDFALDLADRLPVLRLAPVEIKTLAPGDAICGS